MAIVHRKVKIHIIGFPKKKKYYWIGMQGEMLA